MHIIVVIVYDTARYLTFSPLGLFDPSLEADVVGCLWPDQLREYRLTVNLLPLQSESSEMGLVLVPTLLGGYESQLCIVSIHYVQGLVELVTESLLFHAHNIPSQDAISLYRYSPYPSNGCSQL